MTLIQKRDSIIKALPSLKGIIRGTLLKYHHEHCKCHPNGKYGPYWYLSMSQNGRTKMRKLQDTQVPEIRKALKTYDKYRKMCEEIFQINIKLARGEEK